MKSQISIELLVSLSLAAFLVGALVYSASSSYSFEGISKEAGRLGERHLIESAKSLGRPFSVYGKTNLTSDYYETYRRAGE